MKDIKNMSGIVSEGETTVNAENIAFGDQHIYISEDAEPGGVHFRSTKLTIEEEAILPIVQSKVLDILMTNRVIIVNTGNSIDILDYQDALIMKLQEKVDYGLFEMIGNQNDQSILQALLKEESQRIFVLNDLDPLHIDFNLSELLGIIVRKDFYLVITTKSQKERWEMAGGQLDDLWVNLDPEKMFDSSQIRMHFYQGLKKSEFLTIPDDFSEDLSLSNNHKASSVLDHISRPLQLTLFVERYNQFSELPSDKELERIVDQIGGKSAEIIERWFSQLSHSQKLIAIAFALFDGALISQFFAGLERLLSKDSVWKISAPELAAIDFKDIAFLSPFIHKEQAKNQERIVSSRTDYKRVVFKTLWQTHRRHLLNIFPNLIDILSESYNRNTTNWELFGTTQRRSILRQSFVDAISDLGTVNLDAAENVLLDLAANGHFYIQGLVATSLAKWRSLDKDEQLFELLERWQNDTVVVELVKEKLTRRERTISSHQTSKDYAIECIKTTVAITLSRAAEYDQKNCLDERLILLYGELAKDSSQKVQLFISKSLPQFIHKHIQQLSSLIFEDLMKYGYYTEAISLGLFRAFEDSPASIKSLLTDWLESCFDSVSDENRRKKTTYRDNVLITIIDCIQLVYKNAELRAYYSHDELYELLLKLLSTEGREAVRASTLALLGEVIKSSFTEAVHYMGRIKKLLSMNEGKILINDLTSEYILQRSRLSGGEELWKYSEIINIPVWMNRLDRPITALESEMFEWINLNNSVAREFATLLFLNISLVVEEREINFISQEQARRADLERNQAALKKNKIINTQQATRSIGINFWVKVRIFFMLLFESRENRRTLKDLLKFLLNIRGYKLVHIRMMNRKWKKYDPNRLGGKLGTWLDKLL